MRKSGLLFTAIAVILLLALAGTASADNVFRKLFGRHRHFDGSGDLTSEVRELESFERIESKGPIDIYVEVGPEQSIELHIDDNLTDHVYTEVHRGVLEVFTEDNLHPHRRARIEITVPSLEEVNQTGSADIEVAGAKSEMFDLRISGSGDIDLKDIEVGEISIRISGSGDVVADGTADMVDIRISGSGDVDARELLAKDADIHIAGSGDVKVYASERFDGSVAGSGDITFWGDPEDVNRHVRGSGSIRRR